jgi:tRNA pseudouridine55 synthase
MVGHLGTLDPMATGVLPLLLGKYTRLAQFFGPMPKAYSGAIRFGFSTDTYDADGIPVAPVAICLPTNEEIQAAAVHFRGQVEQTPPPFSAKKVDGKPAYKAARRGETVVLKPVSLMIEEFVIGELEGEYAEFTMRISSGGYVRSVAHDLGRALFAPHRRRTLHARASSHAGRNVRPGGCRRPGTKSASSPYFITGAPRHHR